ncbi:MAG: hypothetical protein JXA96_17330 [Sedimentisphaerales bacterium]|nr:hypothetical protein [Sedimentisphaerales bacterium]
MANVIDLDNLTLKDVEKLKNALGIKEQETPEQMYERMQREIGTRPGYMKVIQINMGKNKYFCETEEQERIFTEKHSGMKTESFKIELPVSSARKYLDDPVNKAAFERKEEK